MIGDAKHKPTLGAACLFGLLTLGSAVAAVTLFGLLDAPARRSLAGPLAIEGLSIDEASGSWQVLDAKLRRIIGGQSAAVSAVGDSSCLVGFSPAEFSAVSGRDALNLGTHGHVGVSGYRVMAEAMLARGQVRDVLLLWVHAGTLARTRASTDAFGYAAWIRARLAGARIEQGFLPRTNGTWGGLLRERLLRRHGGTQRGGDSLEHSSTLARRRP